MAGSDKFALVSVFRKDGIVEFAKVLDELGFKIISTGGTAKILTQNKIPVIPVEKITRNPESFDGRMKTISYQIEGGILFDRKKQKHTKEAKKLKVPRIDVVVSNLYPFEETVAKTGVSFEDAIANIDIGGPTMIRAAAKNHTNVLVVTDPKDYDEVSIALKKGRVEQNLRQKLAAKAFAYLSFYDSQIANFLETQEFPEYKTIPGRKIFDLRYGENPHQKAALYLEPNTNSPFKNIEKISGRNLSFLNLTDIASGIESVRFFKNPCAVVIKHNTPCGIALGENPAQALSRAIEADPESAFGGVVILNQPIDLKTAEVISSFKEERHGNIDIICAPAIKENGKNLLKGIRKSMGIYIFNKITKKASGMNLKFIGGGFVSQSSDSNLEEGFSEWKVATKAKPTKKQIEQMKIAWKFISRIKSNAIIVMDGKLPMTRGIGTGQTSRVRSTKIAINQAGQFTKGAILASDSFFPFEDSVNLAKEAGIGAIIQQGGSINDQVSIDVANAAGIPMVFTNRRAFWH